MLPFLSLIFLFEWRHSLWRCLVWQRVLKCSLSLSRQGLIKHEERIPRQMTRESFEGHSSSRSSWRQTIICMICSKITFRAQRLQRFRKSKTWLLFNRWRDLLLVSLTVRCTLGSLSLLFKSLGFLSMINRRIDAWFIWEILFHVTCKSLSSCKRLLKVVDA